MEFGFVAGIRLCRSGPAPPLDSVHRPEGRRLVHPPEGTTVPLLRRSTRAARPTSSDANRIPRVRLASWRRSLKLAIHLAHVTSGGLRRLGGRWVRVVTWSGRARPVARTRVARQ